LADEAAFEARSRWRVIEERTRDQNYKLDLATTSTMVLTGEPDVDGLPLPYVRPSAIAAA
jgi:hypothetical protein